MSIISIEEFEEIIDFLIDRGIIQNTLNEKQIIAIVNAYFEYVIS